MQAIDNDKRKRSENQFTRIAHSARSPTAGKMLQRRNAIVERLCHSFCGRRIPLANVHDDCCQVVGGLWRPAYLHLGMKCALDALANCIVRQKFTSFQRRKTFFDLNLEPFFMFEIACNQLLHHLVRAASCSPGEFVQPCLDLGGQ